MTFRKPNTMEYNVAEATKLYSEVKEDSGLIYPTYNESKKRFKKAYRKLQEFTFVPGVSEDTPLETRVDYVKAFQELNNSYEALVTYDEYNEDIVSSDALKNQVSILEEQVGVYQTVKGSLVDEGADGGEKTDLSSIEFYSDNSIKLYDIDSSYIDQLLGTYAANSSDVREEIEKALKKLNKAECVKDVYRQILNAFDEEQIDPNEDIFVVKRHYFNEAIDQIVGQFAEDWFVSGDELQSSRVQYIIGEDPIPNIKGIIESKNFEGYKSLNPEAKPFKYPQEMKRAWRGVLDEELIPLEDELR